MTRPGLTPGTGQPFTATWNATPLKTIFKVPDSPANGLAGFLFRCRGETPLWMGDPDTQAGRVDASALQTIRTVSFFGILSLY